MDNHDKVRLALLLQRQVRARRAPAALDAWREIGVAATALDDERTERLIGWLRAHWRQPDQLVSDLAGHLQFQAQGKAAAVILDFWEWDEAVAVLVPTLDLLRNEHRLRDIYPNGFCIADQSLSRAVLVDFDEHASSTQISFIEVAK